MKMNRADRKSMKNHNRRSEQVAEPTMEEVIISVVKNYDGEMNSPQVRERIFADLQSISKRISMADLDRVYPPPVPNDKESDSPLRKRLVSRRQIVITK